MLVPIGGRSVRLLVRRIPTGGEDEAELEIFFRDSTNDTGHLSGRPVRLAHPSGRRPLPAGLQPRPQSLLRLQLGVPLPRAVARQHDRRGGGGGRALPGRRTRDCRREPIALETRNGRARRCCWPSCLGVRAEGARESGERVLDLAGGALPFGRTDRARGRPVARRALQRHGMPALLGRAAGRGQRRCSRWPTMRPRSRPARRRFAGGDVSQRRQPRAARDSLPGGPRPAGRSLAGARAASRAVGTRCGSSDFGTTPRVIELRNGKAGLEGTIISNTGDYGHFAGRVQGDSFALAHFDGSYVYMLTGAISGGGGARPTPCAASFTPGSAPRLPRWPCGARARPTSRRSRRSPPRTPADRSASPFPTSRVEWSPSEIPGSRERSCWWTCSGPGARPVTTRHRSWCIAPEVSGAGTGDRRAGVRGLGRYGRGSATDPALSREVRDRVSSPPGGDQRHRGGRGHAAPAAGIHLVSDHDFPGKRRTGTADPGRLLRTGHRGAAREAGPGVGLGGRGRCCGSRPTRERPPSGRCRRSVRPGPPSSRSTPRPARAPARRRAASTSPSASASNVVGSV